MGTTSKGNALSSYGSGDTLYIKSPNPVLEGKARDLGVNVVVIDNISRAQWDGLYNRYLKKINQESAEGFVGKDWLTKKEFVHKMETEMATGAFRKKTVSEIVDLQARSSYYHVSNKQAKAIAENLEKIDDERIRKFIKEHGGSMANLEKWAQIYGEQLVDYLWDADFDKFGDLFKS